MKIIRLCCYVQGNYDREIFLSVPEGKTLEDIGHDLTVVQDEHMDLLKRSGIQKPEYVSPYVYLNELTDADSVEKHKKRYLEYKKQDEIYKKLARASKKYLDILKALGYEYLDVVEDEYDWKLEV